MPFLNITRTKFGVYQARLTLPVVVTRHFPFLQREYRRSLKTRERPEAKYRHAILQARFHEGIQIILAQIAFMSTDQVQNVINATLRFNSMGTIKTGYSFEFHNDGSLKGVKTDGTQQDHDNAMEHIKLHQGIGQQSYDQTRRVNTVGSNNSKNLHKRFQVVADEYLSDNRHKWVQATVDQ